MSGTENKDVVEPLLTVEEVARWLRFTEGTVRQKVKAKEIPFVKVGSSTRFRRADIEAWIEEHQPTDSGEAA